eukprot:TRINITY_DN6311_c0_g1_i3.p1 TRINITY_DN6311_c0_g1~~TRINITY_DN6311_c0_g1_i3.p1  ORF type:complete len:218 (-),score=52.44 TRINITY_DN6311_c0_g1_i3:126-779(-)
MELELLHGIFSRLGQYCIQPDTSKRQKHKAEAPVKEKIVEDNSHIQNFAKRDAYLAEKYRVVKEKSECSMESGYSSLMESGYSSHRESKSSSPIPLPVENEETRSLEWQDPDRRDRVWLVCQTGVLPARVVQEEEPNKQLQKSLNELSLKSLSDNGTFENKSIRHKGDMKHSDSEGHRIQSKDKKKQCDDISLKTLAESYNDRNDNEKSSAQNQKTL